MTQTSSKTVAIPCGDIKLPGLLGIPSQASGLVIFAHGSGSSRLSPRNQYIADELQKENLATLLFDLLDPEEEKIDDKTMEYRFDIEFLANRLSAATNWAKQQSQLSPLPMGYFGASTGAAAALLAAAQDQAAIQAIVSRGGRPDLAGQALIEIKAATLLIVGGDDESVIELNRLAYEELECEKQLAIVPGATHLFEEPGTLEQVSALARKWFKHHLIS